MHEIRDPQDFANPNVVKVVVNLAGEALYFSRSLIPYPRKSEGHRVFEHIGLYAYRRDFLLKYAALPQTPLEKLESLEQLRVLEHGYRLRVVETRQPYVPLSVDTPEDLERARELARELEAGQASREAAMRRPAERRERRVSARFRGPFAAMVTPFSDDGAQVSEPRLAAYCEFLIAQGIGGLFAFGTTGEWPLLSEEERVGGARALVRQAAGRVPVIVHAGAHGTAQAVRLARAAREAGAAAASLISPPFYPLDEEALLEHFTAVARAVPGFPVFLYNIPEYAGNDISPSCSCGWPGRRTT